MVMSEESHVGGSRYRHDSRGQRAEGRNICSTFPGPGWPGALMGWQRRSQRQDKLERDSYGAVAAMDGDGCDILTLLPVRKIMATGTPSPTVPFLGVLMFFSSTGADASGASSW